MRRPWAVPALAAAFAAALHLRLYLALPDPVLNADSAAYLEPVLSAVFGRASALDPRRGVGYPAFLYVVLTAARSLGAVLAAQHLLCLAGGALTAAAYHLGLRRSLVEASLVGALAAILPKAMLCAHTLMTETLYTALLLATTALWCARRGRGPSWGALLGVLTGLAMTVKPTGLALLAVFGGAALLESRGKLKAVLPLALGAALPLLAASAWNRAERGFFGLERFSGYSLFGTSAPYLDVEAVEDAQLRRALADVYTLAPEKLADPNWVRFDPAGPAAAVERSVRGDRIAADAALLRLALRAVAAHPFRFALDRAAGAARYLRDGAYPGFGTKEEVVFKSLSLFGQVTAGLPEARRLLSFDPAGYAPYLEALRRVRAYPFDWTAATLPIEGLLFFTMWLPCLALVGSIGLLRAPGARPTVLALWAIILAHAVLNAVGAGSDFGRHSVPIEPLLLALAAAGLAAAMEKGTMAASR